MRRALAFLALIVLLVLVAWWALHEDAGPGDGASDPAAAAGTPIAVARTCRTNHGTS